MRTLAKELERAMRAMSVNDLRELEDSIANQQDLSAQLRELVDGSKIVGTTRETIAAEPVDVDLMREIKAANGELQNLNLRYSILLRHASRSVELMASLFSSLSGQLQEASGPRPKYQTWSCQM
jgi:hypothetical protein